jgi:hypothetical protein
VDVQRVQHAVRAVRPGAAAAADLLSLHIYVNSFVTWNFGLGSAMSVLLLLFLMIVDGDLPARLPDRRRRAVRETTWLRSRGCVGLAILSGVTLFPLYTIVISSIKPLGDVRARSLDPERTSRSSRTSTSGRRSRWRTTS